MARRTGMTRLWLVSGEVPHFKEMVALAGPITEAIVNEFGTQEFVRRLSDPFFFQSLACALGFEWNTSGSTTVTSAALKIAVNPLNLGVKIAGGKGLKGYKAPEEIERFGDALGLREKEVEKTKYASRMSAKVDNVALQDLSGSIYFHSTILDEKGNWSVVQQKMDVEEQEARRYHWLETKKFTEEPHTGIVADEKKEVVLDLTAKKSFEAKKTITDLVKDKKPKQISNMLLGIIKEEKQTKLADFFEEKVVIQPFLKLPRRIDLYALNKAYELKVKDFEELIGIRGIGPGTIRGLSFIADLIYGSEPSWIDPAKYNWAFGSKIGYPYGIQFKEMQTSAEILKTAIDDAKIGKPQRIDAIKRLKQFFYHPAQLKKGLF